MNIMLAEFGRYVRDHHRTALFREALASEVRSGDVVLDLGTGFGLLAMLAVRAGARRVYAVEQAEYVELARAIAHDNGVADRITFIHGHSAAIDLPEAVDVIVAELLGQFALEEYLVECVHDAAARWLRPGGRVIPSVVRLQLTPVELPALRQRWLERYSSPWNADGLDLRRLQNVVLCNELAPYVVHPFGADDRALGPPQVVETFDMPSATTSTFHRQLECVIDRAGTLDGFLGTFDARLSSAVTLSTAVTAPPTHWQQVVFGLFPSRTVVAGTRLAVDIGFERGGSWRYALRE